MSGRISYSCDGCGKEWTIGAGAITDNIRTFCDACLDINYGYDMPPSIQASRPPVTVERFTDATTR